jgi:excalibur calcium-binding domain-containing protein
MLPKAAAVGVASVALLWGGVGIAWSQDDPPPSPQPGEGHQNIDWVIEPKVLPDRPVASAVVPAVYKNCTALNKKYAHGVGRANARDKTSDEPVTTFKRSTRLYRIAISYNKGLDRDKDGIACEKQ